MVSNAHWTDLQCLELTVPVGHILVCDTGCDIKHDDTTLSVDVVTIAQATELLLSCSVPDIELNLAQVLSPNIRVVSSKDHKAGAVRTVVKPRG
jgi:hypothetical protein